MAGDAERWPGDGRAETGDGGRRRVMAGGDGRWRAMAGRGRAMAGDGRAEKGDGGRRRRLETEQRAVDTAPNIQWKMEAIADWDEHNGEQ